MLQRFGDDVANLQEIDLRAADIDREFAQRPTQFLNLTGIHIRSIHPHVLGEVVPQPLLCGREPHPHRGGGVVGHARQHFVRRRRDHRGDRVAGHGYPTARTFSIGCGLKFVSERTVPQFAQAQVQRIHDDEVRHDDGHQEHEPEHESHAREHEREVERKFSGRKVTNYDIVWFGLTGGLLPCPSAIAVLLICVQLKAFTLGFLMVAGFSAGLAITLMSVGVLAAWGARKASEGWSGFAEWSEKLPVLSAGVVAIVGLLVTGRGLIALGAL